MKSVVKDVLWIIVLLAILAAGRRDHRWREVRYDFTERAYSGTLFKK
jgi:hypothetical protein